MAVACSSRLRAIRRKERPRSLTASLPFSGATPPDNTEQLQNVVSARRLNYRIHEAFASFLDQRRAAGTVKLSFTARPGHPELSFRLARALTCMPRMFVDAVVPHVSGISWFVSFLARHKSVSFHQPWFG
jgi:hypothetical protein